MRNKHLPATCINLKSLNHTLRQRGNLFLNVLPIHASSNIFITGYPNAPHFRGLTSQGLLEFSFYLVEIH